ncbi:MAG: carbohydrate kinase family protein [Ruminococcus sp.]|jgi:fructokinase
METKKNTLLAIGEALIDFIPGQTGKKIKEVSEFQPIVGGAPANVCGAFVKLGGRARMITQLGMDPFGDKILDEFKRCGIDCDGIKRTEEANTSLAFVALAEDGNREFSFYRKPGADMLLDPAWITPRWFEDGYCLHFCSVSLGDYPMKEAHKRAIELARQAGMIISFDPNLRRPLWNDDQGLKKAVLEFLPLADVLKISDEELFFITGCHEPEQALDKLFQGHVRLVVYTQGAGGASAFTKEAHAHVPGIPVKALDTTGAGDAFIGSFLYQLYEQGIQAKDLASLTAKKMESFLDFSNRCCAWSIQKKGAIASYPTKKEMALNYGDS